MKSRQLAFTLPEILVVVAILAILVATVGLLVGPRIKARAVETRIKSDLHQLSVAVNLYTAENEGGFPPNFRRRDLPGLPHYCEGCSRFSPVPPKQPSLLSPTVKNPYIYKWPIAYWKIEQNARGLLRYPYDPNVFPLFEAQWFNRPLGKVTVEFFSAPGVFQNIQQEMTLVPAVRLDGSLYWKRNWENWQFERAASIGYIFGRPSEPRH